MHAAHLRGNPEPVKCKHGELEEMLSATELLSRRKPRPQVRVKNLSIRKVEVNLTLSQTLACVSSCGSRAGRCCFIRMLKVGSPHPQFWQFTVWIYILTHVCFAFVSVWLHISTTRLVRLRHVTPSPLEGARKFGHLGRILGSRVSSKKRLPPPGSVFLFRQSLSSSNSTDSFSF